jgi:hypothetical protein
MLGLAFTTTAGAAPAVLEVRSTSELHVAVATATRGERIHLFPGIYDLDRPLLVPDGVALMGDGEVRIDANGTALEWSSMPVPTLRFAAELDTDALTLGDGAVLSGLRIESRAAASTDEPGPGGNLVAIVSRRPADRVSATIRGCEIVNPNAFRIGRDGPANRAILVVTRHRIGTAVASTHVGAHISLAVEHSIVRSPDSDVLFANNFAARGRVDLSLQGNRFEGHLSASGGTTRLDEVSDSITTIDSSGNLFLRTGTFDAEGWQLLGGTSAPHATTRIPGVYRNTLRLTSLNDRIEGFRIGIWAAAGRRVAEFSDPVSHNRLELDLVNTVIRTIDPAGADLSLYGAVAFGASPSDSAEFEIGDDNQLRADIRGAHGSGPRSNVFWNVTGPVLPARRGTGNRVIVLGDENEFSSSNPGIEPIPPCHCWQSRPRNAPPGR